MGAAEAYMDGSLEVEDLASLTRLFVRNVQVLDKLDGGVTSRTHATAAFCTLVQSKYQRELT